VLFGDLVSRHWQGVLVFFGYFSFFRQLQRFQSEPVPGTFTRLRSCIVPAEIIEPPKLSVVRRPTSVIFLSGQWKFQNYRPIDLWNIFHKKLMITSIAEFLHSNQTTAFSHDQVDGINLHFCTIETVMNCIFVHVLEKKTPMRSENTRFKSVIKIQFSYLRFLSTSTKIVLECFITLRPESSYVKTMYML
jgi:hypothetical protein